MNGNPRFVCKITMKTITFYEITGAEVSLLTYIYHRESTYVHTTRAIFILFLDFPLFVGIRLLLLIQSHLFLKACGHAINKSSIIKSAK